MKISSLLVFSSFCLLLGACSKGPKPAAAFTFEPTSALARDTVKFTNQTTNADSYSWTFGDDSVSTLENPGHIYMKGGTYNVTLTATGIGGTHVASQSVTILPSVTGGWTSTFTTQQRDITGSLTLIQHTSGAITGTAQIFQNAGSTALTALSKINGDTVIIETVSQGTKFAFKGTLSEDYDMITGNFFQNGQFRSNWYALKKRK